MRKSDSKKTIFQKASKTINFDKMILDKLEKRATMEGTKVSSIVNDLCRRYVFTDEGFFNEMIKEHHLQAMRYRYMLQEIQLKKQNDSCRKI